MYYNNYINNRWQAPTQNQMAMQQQILPQQQQMIQQQFPQIPQQQMLGLKGRLVSSVDEVKAMPVDMDGSETYFPYPAGNAIFTKAIDMNGNQVIRKYVLDNSNGSETSISDLDKRIKFLEDMMENFTGEGTKK